MKYKKYIKNIGFIVVAIVAAAACKKVEKNDEFLRAIPSVTTSATLIKKDGSILPYTYPFITSTKSTATVALVGDTITIVGYLGGPDATIEVKVGDVIVPVFNRTQYESQISQTKEKTTLDFLQFVISKDLTTGNNIAVNITVNGRSIIAPSIIIGEFTDIPSSTDTTLVVEQIAEWLPASTAPYNGGNLWVAGTVTQNGNIYFLNAQGIFRINATGSLEQIIANGASITPDGGAAFTISSLVGMTVDIDEKVLYCSASVTEPGPDNGNYYFTRLCRMDLPGNQITVLNRSVFQRLRSFYKRAANLTDILYDPTLNYLPAQGSTSDVKMALTNLKLTVDGTLYAINQVYNTSITPKSNIKLPMFKDPEYYVGRDSINAGTWFNALKAGGSVNNGMGNFVQIRNGNLRSLFRANTTRPVPASAIKNISADYQLGTDNRTLYQTTGLSIEKTTLDDLESQSILSSFEGPFSFSGQDQSTITGLPNTPSLSFGSGGFGGGSNNFPAYAVLSNNNIILFPTTALRLSVLGVDAIKNNAYVFAGTEKGLMPPDNLVVAGQDKGTGPAKWVNFRPKNGSSTFFIGFDRNNNIYFGKHYKTGVGATTQYDPLKIYVIKKP